MVIRRRQRVLLFPVKLRLKLAPMLFTRRFEAQLHWSPSSFFSRSMAAAISVLTRGSVTLAARFSSAIR